MPSSPLSRAEDSIHNTVLYSALRTVCDIRDPGRVRHIYRVHHTGYTERFEIPKAESLNNYGVRVWSVRRRYKSIRRVLHSSFGLEISQRGMPCLRQEVQSLDLVNPTVYLAVVRNDHADYEKKQTQP